MGDWANSVAEKGDKIAEVVQRPNRIGIENIGTKLRNGRTRIPLVGISHLPDTSLCTLGDQGARKAGDAPATSPVGHYPRYLRVEATASCRRSLGGERLAMLSSGVGGSRVGPYDLPLKRTELVKVGMPVSLTRNVAALHHNFEL